MVEERPGSKRKDMGAAGTGFLYPPSYFDPNLKREDWKPTPKVIPERIVENPIAPLETRTKAYQDMTFACGLSPEHKEHLLNIRRLPEAMLTNYATLPSNNKDREEIAEAVLTYNPLIGIPGFFQPLLDTWSIAGPAGILIPYRTRDGQIQGFQIRRDGEAEGRPRYIWLSTPPEKYRKGTASGAFINYGNWKKNTPDLWVCEGGLKADISAHHTGESFIGLPGVALGDLEKIISQCKVNALPRLIFCPDADFRDNWHVWTNWFNNMKSASEYFQEIRIAIWDPEQGKGVDDYILNTGKLPKHISPKKWKEQFREPPKPEPKRPATV